MYQVAPDLGSPDALVASPAILSQNPQLPPVFSAPALLLLDLLFQVVYYNNPGNFALFGLWSVAGVANILFLFNLLSAFSARQNIRIEEGKRVEIL